MHEELLDSCKGKNLTGVRMDGTSCLRGVGAFQALKDGLLRWEREAGMVCPLRIAKPECGGENGCGDDSRSQSKGGDGELSAAGSAFCCLRRVGNMGETF